MARGLQFESSQSAAVKAPSPELGALIHTEAAYLKRMRMTVLASGSKGNSTVIASARTRVLVDAGLSCRELLKRMKMANEDASALDAILITHEHTDHVAGLSVLARRLRIPVYFSEPTHRAWVRQMTPRTKMTYAKWLDHLQEEKEARATLEAIESRDNADPECGVQSGSIQIAAAIGEGDEEEDVSQAAVKRDSVSLPAVEYFQPGTNFCIGDLTIAPFTTPHDAADPCGFVFESATESIRMAIATDLGYMPPNVRSALQRIDVLLLESNHDLEMLKDGPYPWAVKQRVLSRVGHLSNHATAEFLARDYDGNATYIVLGHLSETNNVPELALMSAEEAIRERGKLLGNRVLLAQQSEPLASIFL
ncbi:MAG TPA: MBL fold metallo-hydrolase [Acidobacteriaceae bacterium]|nr:MBL fold metallo-hydrolase [Acidobacteriaceae bacterium]